MVYGVNILASPEYAVTAIISYGTSSPLTFKIPDDDGGKHLFDT